MRVSAAARTDISLCQDSNGRNYFSVSRLPSPLMDGEVSNLSPALRSPATTFCLTLWSPANQNVVFTYSLAPIVRTRHQDLTSPRELDFNHFDCICILLCLIWVLRALSLKVHCAEKGMMGIIGWSHINGNVKTKHWKNQTRGIKRKECSVK